MSITARRKSQPSTCYRFHPKPVVQVAVSPSGDTICSLATDGKIRIWSEDDKSPTVAASIMGTPTALAWTDSGMYAGTKEGMVHAIKLGSGPIKGFKMYAAVIGLFPAGDQNQNLIVQLASRSVLIFNTVSGSITKRLIDDAAILSLNQVWNNMFAFMSQNGKTIHVANMDSLQNKLTINVASSNSALGWIPAITNWEESGKENHGFEMLLGNAFGFIQKIYVDAKSGSFQDELNSKKQPITTDQMSDLETKIDKVSARLNSLLAETEKLSIRTQENADLISNMWTSVRKLEV